MCETLRSRMFTEMDDIERVKELVDIEPSVDQVNFFFFEHYFIRTTLHLYFGITKHACCRIIRHNFCSGLFIKGFAV